MRSRLIGALLCAATAACGGATDPTATDPTVTDPPVTDPTATDPPVTVDLDAVLAAKLRRYDAPGAIAVIAVGDRRISGQAGAADLDGTPITADTRFRIGSASKPITAALVLDAVQRGELSLDDLVDDLVPGLLTEDPPVPVRMLLDHTAGIFDQTNNPDILDDIALLTDPAQAAQASELLDRALAGEAVIVPDTLLVAAAEAHGRDFPAGTDQQYSNLNYQVAAIVLEAVTGRSFAELLQERIVEPLGLRHTTVAPSDRSTPEFHGYGVDLDDGSLVDITDELTFIGNGASGGVISTVDELATIMLAIVGGDLLEPTMRAEMRTPTELSEGTYGLGLATYGLTCGTFHGHEGAVNGTVSIALVSDDGANAVVATVNLRNRTDPKMAALADDLLCPALR